MELKRARSQLANRDVYIEVEIARRMGEVVKLVQEVSIQALIQLAEGKDHPNGRHFLRIREYVRALARKLQTNPRFPVLSDQVIEMLHKTAPLHDIGQIIVPDQILYKPDKLTLQEWAIIKSHTEMGAEVIDQVGRHEQSTGQVLVFAKEIVLHHHERWDGAGYPLGLAGNKIPIAARLISLADAFDALISKRTYRQAASCEEARSIIMMGRGKQFDPDVVDAFVGIFDEFKLIAKRHADIDNGSVPFAKTASHPLAGPWAEPMSNIRAEPVPVPHIEAAHHSVKPLENKIESLAEKLRAIEMELGASKRS
jgi:putative two-component system response regulator